MRARRLTTGAELCSYLLAQAVGLGCGLSVGGVITPSLGQASPRERELFLPGLVAAIVTIALVMAIFLVVRRTLARSDDEAGAQDAIGFGLGLAGLWFSVHTIFGAVMTIYNGVSGLGAPVGPDKWFVLAVPFSAAAGLWFGGSIAYWSTRKRSEPDRVVWGSFITQLVAFPVSALLVAVAGTILLPGLGPLRTLSEMFFGALVFGTLAYVVPALVLTFLWSLLFFRLRRPPHETP